MKSMLCVPQPFLLGPTVFLLYINNLSKSTQITPQGVSSKYLDDQCLLGDPPSDLTLTDIVGSNDYGGPISEHIQLFGIPMHSCSLHFLGLSCSDYAQLRHCFCNTILFDEVTITVDQSRSLLA